MNKYRFLTESLRYVPSYITISDLGESKGNIIHCKAQLFIPQDYYWRRSRSGIDENRDGCKKQANQKNEPIIPV